MRGSALFAFRAVPAIASMLAARRIDARTVLRDVGLPQTGDLVAPLARIRRLLDRTAALLDRPQLGFDLADLIAPGTFGLAEFVGRFAPTVRRGLETFCESVPLVNPIIEWRYIAGRREHAMHLDARDALGRHLGEYSVAVVIKLANAGLDHPLRVTRAWFAHGRRDAPAIAARLGYPVDFGEPDAGFAFAAADAARAPRMADPALFAFHADEARQRVGALGGDDVIAQVTRTIEARMPRADVQLDAVAAALGLTARTLQRRLTDAGTSYRAVLAHVRRRRRAELRRERIPNAKIAALLGFADLRAMRRALDE